MGLVHNPNIVSDGLVGCWDAANKRSYPPGAGTTWTDLAGSYSATLINGPTFADVSLGVIALDGTNDSVKVPIIDGQNGFSFSIWLYFLTIPADDYTAFSIYNGSGAEFMFYVLEASRYTVSYMLGIRGAGTGNTLTSTNTAYGPGFNVGKWVHYCATYNGGGTTTVGNYKVYFNGQGTDINLVENFGGSGNQDPMKWGEDVGAGDLNGYMGHITFYNRALTATEALQNYEATKSRFLPRITKSDLVGNWDAGDPESYSGGTTWKDTANHYDGTLENDDDGSLTFDSANGGSLVFDGTDDYVGPIAIGDHSSTARSVIIWAAADSYAQSNHEHFTAFNSATDKFSASLGLSNHAGYFYFKSKMTHTSAYQWGIASTSLVAGSWHCWAVTINASDEIVAIYQDGESKTSAHNDGVHLKDDTYIGCRMDGSSVQNPWAGKIGTVRLYTKTLSAAEIMDNFQKTRGRFGV